MIEIADDELCWCCSGNCYGICCKNTIIEAGGHTFRKEIYECVAKNNYVEALKYCRANFTQYLRMIKSNTMPIMFSQRVGDAKKFIEMDINALSEILDEFMYIVKKGNLKLDFEEAIEKSKKIFFNERWHKYADYYFVSWRYLVLNDRKSANDYLKSKVDIKRVSDVVFLQMIYDLASDEMTFSEQVDMLEIIIAKSDFVEKLHYQSILGLQYLVLAGDTKKAIKLHNEALLLYEHNKNKISDAYEWYIIANVHAFAGRIKGDKNLSIKATELFLNAINSGNLTNNGLGEIYGAIGVSYLDAGLYDSAYKYIELSLENFQSSIIEIYKMLTLIYQEDYEKATHIADSIEYSKLSTENKLDYLIAYARLLVFKKDKSRMEFVISEMQLQKVEQGYFSMVLRDSIIKLLVEYKDGISEEKNESSGIKLLSEINKYLILKPTIFGFGVDFNKIIKKILKN